MTHRLEMAGKKRGGGTFFALAFYARRVIKSPKGNNGPKCTRLDLFNVLLPRHILAQVSPGEGDNASLSS